MSSSVYTQINTPRRVISWNREEAKLSVNNMKPGQIAEDFLNACSLLKRFVLWFVSNSSEVYTQSNNSGDDLGLNNWQLVTRTKANSGHHVYASSGPGYIIKMTS